MNHNSTSSIWVWDAKCPNISTLRSNGTCIHIYRDSVVAVGLTSSNLSILGAIFIIATYIFFEELRTKARLILLMISIADLVNSLSYVFAFVYTSFNVDYSLCYAYKPFGELYACAVQSAVNLFATLASSCWTCILGIHITCLFYRINPFDNKYGSVFLHTFPWVAPLIVTSVAFILNILGPGTQSVNVGWCFVKNYTSTFNKTDNTNVLLEEFFISKFWEFATVFILGIVYTVSSCRICRFNYRNEGIWAFRERHDFRLIWIPFIYLLLRLWGNIRWILGNVWVSQNNECSTAQAALAFMEVVGDTGQGWANAILYVIFNQAMRKRLIVLFCGIFKKKRKLESTPLLKSSDVTDIQSYDKKNDYC